MLLKHMILQVGMVLQRLPHCSLTSLVELSTIYSHIFMWLRLNKRKHLEPVIMKNSVELLTLMISCERIVDKFIVYSYVILDILYLNPRSRPNPKQKENSIHI